MVSDVLLLAKSFKHVTTLYIYASSTLDDQRQQYSALLRCNNGDVLLGFSQYVGFCRDAYQSGRQNVRWLQPVWIIKYHALIKGWRNWSRVGGEKLVHRAIRASKCTDSDSRAYQRTSLVMFSRGYWEKQEQHDWYQQTENNNWVSTRHKVSTNKSWIENKESFFVMLPVWKEKYQMPQVWMPRKKGDSSIFIRYVTCRKMCQCLNNTYF